MRKSIVLLIFVLANTYSRSQSIAISGFNDSSALEEVKKEKAFDDLISRENIGLTIRDLSSKPHNLGSAGSKEVAEKIQQKFREYGLETHMEIYQVLFPEPKVRLLEMTAPVSYHAVLKSPL